MKTGRHSARFEKASSIRHRQRSRVQVIEGECAHDKTLEPTRARASVGIEPTDPGAMEVDWRRPKILEGR
jgi:hypothetical protein